MIARFKPQEAAVEETFVNKDARATLKLGQARGMALLAPAQGGLRVAEYPPNVIKKTVTGTGHGEKRQIAAMVGFLLPEAHVRERGRGRRAGDRHLPRQPPHEPRLAAMARTVARRTCREQG